MHGVSRRNILIWDGGAKISLEIWDLTEFFPMGNEQLKTYWYKNEYHKYLNTERKSTKIKWGADSGKMRDIQ